MTGTAMSEMRGIRLRDGKALAGAPNGAMTSGKSLHGI